MQLVSSSQAFLLGLLASVPLAAALDFSVANADLERRYVGSLAARAVISEVEKRAPHHTESQIQAKAQKAAQNQNNNKRQAPDEFGPWDSDVDEFGSWTKREAHHTESQKQAKAQKAAQNQNNKREPEAHHTESQKQAKAQKAAAQGQNNKRKPEAHHTESQKQAKAQKAAAQGQN